MHNPIFKRFIKSLPLPDRRPSMDDLSDICSSSEDLTPLLISVRPFTMMEKSRLMRTLFGRTRCQISLCRKLPFTDFLCTIGSIQRYGSFLHFPNRMFWQGGPHTHAVVFGPFGLYDASGVWVRSTEFSSLHGRVLPLFYGTSTVKYVGNYKCHHALEWFPDGVELPQHVVRPFYTFTNIHLNSYILVKSKRVVANLAYKNAGPVEANSGICSKEELRKHYSKGDLKVDCLVLQCVRFDSGLYNQLLARKNSKRKRGLNTKPGPSKKVRLDWS